MSSNSAGRGPVRVIADRFHLHPIALADVPIRGPEDKRVVIRRTLIAGVMLLLLIPLLLPIILGAALAALVTRAGLVVKSPEMRRARSRRVSSERPGIESHPAGRLS